MLLDETVDVRNSDGYAGSLNVWVSDGESDPGQTVMEAHLPGEYLMICLDLDAACHLRSALDRMIEHHESTGSRRDEESRAWNADHTAMV